VDKKRERNWYRQEERGAQVIGGGRGTEGRRTKGSSPVRWRRRWSWGKEKGQIPGGPRVVTWLGVSFRKRYERKGGRGGEQSSPTVTRERTSVLNQGLSRRRCLQREYSNRDAKTGPTQRDVFEDGSGSLGAFYLKCVSQRNWGQSVPQRKFVGWIGKYTVPCW